MRKSIKFLSRFLQFSFVIPKSKLGIGIQIIAATNQTPQNYNFGKKIIEVATAKCNMHYCPLAVMCGEVVERLLLSMLQMPSVKHQ